MISYYTGIFRVLYSAMLLLMLVKHNNHGLYMYSTCIRASKQTLTMQ